MIIEQIEKDDIKLNFSWWLIKKVAVLAYIHNKTFNEVIEICLQERVNHENVYRWCSSEFNFCK